MDYQDTEHYKTGLYKYLAEGIDYCANTIKLADKCDLEQLAADSYHAGYLLAMENIRNEDSCLNLQRVNNPICHICDTPYSFDEKKHIWSRGCDC